MMKTIEKLFYDTTMGLVPDEILEDEALFIVDATYGPIIHAQKDYGGPCHMSDYKSAYGRVLTTGDYPFTRGTISEITQEQFDAYKYIPYGFYRCVIEFKTDPKIRKQFRYNEKNCYTSLDLETARRLGLKITLEAGKPNACTYANHQRINANSAFGAFIKPMYDLKRQGCEWAKSFITRLWGILGRLNFKRLVHTEGEGELVIDEGMLMIKDSEYIGTLTRMYYLTPQNKIFCSDWARIKPFVLAKGRRLISDVVPKYEDDIVAVYVDAIYTKTKPKDITVSDNMGDLSYKGYEPNIKIEHSKSVLKYKFTNSE
jgi:hypothetical protein